MSSATSLVLAVAAILAVTYASPIALGVNTKTGPHMVMPGMVGTASLDLSGVVSPGTEYDLTLYPCSGKMNWSAQKNDDPEDQVLDWATAAQEHGSHIVKTWTFSAVEATDVLKANVAAIDSSFHAEFVVGIKETGTTSPWPEPTNNVLTVTDGCTDHPGFEGTASVTITWEGTSDVNDAFNVFYHEGATMEEGHIMGTWCGIQALMSDAHMHKRDGHSTGVQMWMNEFQTGVNSACITGLKTQTEYHFDVVARNAADLHTAYNPAMVVTGDADPNGIPVTNNMVLNQHAGPFMAMPGSDTYVLLDLSTIGNTQDSYEVTVYPCSGKMDWFARRNGEAEEQKLDWDVQESEHGVHIIKKHTFSAVTDTDKLWVRVHAYDTDHTAEFVAAIEDSTGSVWPQLPAGLEGITVTNGCEGETDASVHDHDSSGHSHRAHSNDEDFHSSVTVSWTPTGDDGHSYNVYYHPGDTMKEGHIMGTWCGIQAMLADHSHSGHTHRSADSGHSEGIQSYSDTFQSGINSVCISNLSPNTEYHFDVVVRNAADQHTSYHPALHTTDEGSPASALAASLALLLVAVLL